MSLGPPQPLIAWHDLRAPAKAFRIAHAAYALVSLASLGYVWMAVKTDRLDRWLAASVAWLGLEGVALLIGRGDCPFGRVQARLGDPVPLFELVLPPRLAKAAIPILSTISIAGITAVMVKRVRQLHLSTSLA